MGAAADNGAGRSAQGSLVDGAERALRAWLAPDRFRRGDRLPPEQELAGMLGVSRGTLRAALHRLEGSGEIVRRQGSGTFVGRIARPGTAGPPLRIDSFTARHANGALEVTAVDIARAPVGRPVGDAFALPPGRCAMSVQRILAKDSTPAVVAHDVFHPEFALPPVAELRADLQAGRNVLELVESRGVAITLVRARITPWTLTPGDPLAERLALTQTTGCLMVEELVLGAENEPLVYCWDVIAPGSVEIEVVRSAIATAPDREAVRGDEG